MSLSHTEDFFPFGCCLSASILSLSCQKMKAQILNSSVFVSFFLKAHRPLAQLCLSYALSLLGGFCLWKVWTYKSVSMTWFLFCLMVMLLAFPWNPSGDFLIPKYLEKTLHNFWRVHPIEVYWMAFVCLHPKCDWASPKRLTLQMPNRLPWERMGVSWWLTVFQGYLGDWCLYVCHRDSCHGCARTRLASNTWQPIQKRFFYMKTKMNGIQRCKILRWFSFCFSFLAFFWDFLNTIFISVSHGSYFNG